MNKLLVDDDNDSLLRCSNIWFSSTIPHKFYDIPHDEGFVDIVGVSLLRVPIEVDKVEFVVVAFHQPHLDTFQDIC